MNYDLEWPNFHLQNILSVDFCMDSCDLIDECRSFVYHHSGVNKFGCYFKYVSYSEASVA